MGPKKDTKKMSLGDFLADDKYGSWADEMEDAPTIPSSGGSTGYGNRNRDGYGSNNRGYSGGFGGSGGDRGDRDRDREERYPRRENLPLPTKPPFTAHIGNLSFDATEDDISQYFEQCNISSVRLVRDRMGDRPKGFGYVEFQTLDGLKKAIELNNGQLAGRNVRVSVADPPKERTDDRTNVDTWRRSGPLPSTDAAPMKRTNSRFNDAASEAGSERFERRQSGFNREQNEGDGKFRDFSNWERKGPLPASTQTDTQSESGRPPRHDRGDRRRSPAVNPFDRERQPSLQGSEERPERSERPKREYQRPPAPERVPTAAERDTEWRRGARPDVPADQLKEQTKTQTQPSTTSTQPQTAPAKERHAPPPPSPSSLPQTRPKLELKKRGESLVAESNPGATSADPKSSPFGAARPIDTDTKLKEIEEKRAIQAAEKKERDDKLKEERKAAKAAEKAEKGEKKGGKSGDDEPDTPAPGRNFEILRRASAATDDVNSADLDAEEAPETKEEPKQPAKAVPKVQLPREPREQVKKVEEDGWSTVKRGRGANGKV